MIGTKRIKIEPERCPVCSTDNDTIIILVQSFDGGEETMWDKVDSYICCSSCGVLFKSIIKKDQDKPKEKVEKIEEGEIYKPKEKVKCCNNRYVREGIEHCFVCTFDNCPDWF